MIQRILAIMLVAVLISCQSRELWNYELEIPTPGIAPNGIVFYQGFFWLSDTDENRIVKISTDGNKLKEIGDLLRPMHINVAEGSIITPEYFNDTVRLVSENGVQQTLLLPEMPDAPASADMNGKDIAVADFYNHRIIYFKNGENKTFGKKGDAPGDFHYPTDVQFANDKIYVADAYNHRVQVFDLDANHLLTFGQDEKMNAATGLFADEKQIVVTDFENDRLLTYNQEGELLHIIDEGLHRPSDVIIHEGKLYVANYKGKFLAVFN